MVLGGAIALVWLASRPDPKVPARQAELVRLLRNAHDEYHAASGNDLRQANIVAQRKRSLCAFGSEPEVANWSGRFKALREQPLFGLFSPDDAHDLYVEIGDNTTLQTNGDWDESL